MCMHAWITLKLIKIKLDSTKKKERKNRKYHVITLHSYCYIFSMVKRIDCELREWIKEKSALCTAKFSNGAHEEGITKFKREQYSYFLAIVYWTKTKLNRSMCCCCCFYCFEHRTFALILSGKISFGVLFPSKCLTWVGVVQLNFDFLH